MKRIAGVGWLLVVGTAMFWAGVINHFPGATVARILEARLNQDPSVSISVSPVEMDWTRFRVDRISLRGLVAPVEGPWVAFQDTEIPLSFGLSNAIRVETHIGETGQVVLTWRQEEQELQFEARDLALDRLPALRMFPMGQVSGLAQFRGTLKPGAPLPTGQFEGQINDAMVSDISAMGVDVPPTRIQEARFDVTIGASGAPGTVDLKALEFSGDLNGQLTGTIKPRSGRPEQSHIDLQVTLTPRPEWTAKWGDLATIVESFLESGRLEGRLTGTLARPVFRKAGGSR